MLSSVLLMAILAQAPEKPFVSVDGDFRIGFPFTPESKTVLQKRPTGEYTVHNYLCKGEDLAYLLIWTEIPEGIADKNPDAELEFQVNFSLTQKFKGTLVAKRNVSLGKIPGKEFEQTYTTLDGSTGRGVSRIFLTRSRIYHVMIQGEPTAVSRASDAFFRTFAFTRDLQPPGVPNDTIKPVPMPSKPVVKGPATPAEAGIKIAFPDMPGVFHEENPSDNGPIPTHGFQFEKDGLAFRLTFTDYPDKMVQGKTESLLQTVIDTLTGKKRDALLSRKDIKFGSNPGKEIEYTGQNAKGITVYTRSRLYLMKNRLYQISASGSKEQMRSLAADRFIRSFELTRKP
jgi:hypothetical protein